MTHNGLVSVAGKGEHGPGDIKDYAAMNEAYRGRFGRPPVRTTIACYGGIPGSSLVEIDCIAAL